jgi:hypothetical protein
MKYYYILRLFPPLGVLNKYKFESEDMLNLTLSNLYNSMNIDKLDLSNDEKIQWHKNPLKYFIESILISKIDTEICYKHKKLFQNIEKNNRIKIQEIIPFAQSIT